jgi:CubicO group peptidase (beta-lactamase class C family)
MQQAEAVLKAMVDKGHTPSIQYLHFTSTTVLNSFAYGYGNLVKKSPVNIHSMYAIYSLTKTFTAIGVLQLAKCGRVELDHPASDYLPAFPYKEPITIRQLLNHTAGIPNPLPLSWIHFPEEQFDRDKFFAGIFEKNSKLKSQPDSKFLYTNLGYVLLGQLIEAVSGISYEAYIEQNILQPLKLTEAESNFSPGIHQVTGYQKQFSLLSGLLGFFLDKKKYMGNAISGWKPFHPVVVHGPSYGGLMATPDALVRFGQALLSQNPLLDQEGMHSMFTEN